MLSFRALKPPPPVGTVQGSGRRLATVSSKVTGKVEEVLVEEGMSVKSGQELARLEDTTARAQFNVAQRRLEAARRNLAEVEVRLADARRTLERRRALRQSGLVSQNELDAAEAEASALAARLEALEGEVAVEASNVEYNRVGLEDLVVRAPFAFNGLQTSTLNFVSFTAMTFAFSVTPALLGGALLYALALSFIGGLLPAWRAARLPITTGLREL